MSVALGPGSRLRLGRDNDGDDDNDGDVRPLLTKFGDRASGAYPRPLRTMPLCACRGLRRDVDGPIHRFTWPRPAPGRRADGSRSRRLDCDRCRKAPVMAPTPRLPHRGTWPIGPQICSDAKSRRRGVPKGNPRAASPREPAMALGETPHGSPGAGNSPPVAVGTRVTRRTPSGECREADCAWAVRSIP